MSRLSLPVARALIERMKACGADNLVLSGGEPTRHPGLEPLMFVAKNIGFVRVTIFSNGRRFKDKAYTRSLKAAGLSSALISLHGPDAETHASLVGVKEAFGETLEGIDHLLEQGVEVVINTVVSKLNYRRLEDQIEFVARRFSNRTRLQLSDLFATARVFENPGLHVPYRELKPWLANALIKATCLDLPCCTILFPLCVLDPFFMDAFELREEERESLVGGDDFRGLVWRKPEFKSHRCYLRNCRDCSLRPVCPGLSKSYRVNGMEGGLFRPFAHLDPGSCIAANRERDKKSSPAGQGG